MMFIFDPASNYDSSKSDAQKCEWEWHDACSIRDALFAAIIQLIAAFTSNFGGDAPSSIVIDFIIFRANKSYINSYTVLAFILEWA